MRSAMACTALQLRSPRAAWLLLMIEEAKPKGMAMIPCVARGAFRRKSNAHKRVVSFFFPSYGTSHY